MLEHGSITISTAEVRRDNAVSVEKRSIFLLRSTLWFQLDEGIKQQYISNKL